MLGFDLGLWDYITFAALFVLGVGALIAIVFVLGLPGRIAIARKHPDAEYSFARQSLAATTAKSWYQTIESRQLLDLANRNVGIYADLLTLARVQASGARLRPWMSLK